jgi:hypothetical protein
METFDGTLAERRIDSSIDEQRTELAEAHAELSDDALECVVGGLARPWTESGLDGWLVEPVKSVL